MQYRMGGVLYQILPVIIWHDLRICRKNFLIDRRIFVFSALITSAAFSPFLIRTIASTTSVLSLIDRLPIYDNVVRPAHLTQPGLTGDFYFCHVFNKNGNAIDILDDDILNFIDIIE